MATPDPVEQFPAASGSGFPYSLLYISARPTIMAYSFLQRTRHVASRMKEVNSEVITLTRGASTPAVITGCKYLRKPQELSPGGAITRIDVEDWAIDVSAYTVDGIEVEPREGDRIVDSVGNVYLVSSVGEEVYTYTTSERTRYLVHSIRSEAV